MKKLSLSVMALAVIVAASAAFAADNFPPNSIGDFVAQRLAATKTGK